MKKFLLALTTLMVSLSGSAIGLEKLGIANHLGVGVSAGTTGIGVEVSTPITRWVQARVGLAIMPGFHFSTDVDIEPYVADAYGLGDYYNYFPGDPTMEAEASFKRVQGSIIFNVYPFPVGSFYVAAGAYFGGRDLIKITGHSDYYNRYVNAGVSIGDYQIPIDENGDIKGGLKVNSFRPYLGIGWGRAIPKRRVNFGVELGVQFHGKPSVYYKEGNKDVDVLEKFADDSDDDFQKIINNFKIWPVLKFTLSGRIF